MPDYEASITIPDDPHELESNQVPPFDESRRAVGVIAARDALPTVYSVSAAEFRRRTLLLDQTYPLDFREYIVNVTPGYDHEPIYDEIEVANSWERYGKLTNHVATAHPQATTLNRLEFERALVDPRVGKLSLHSPDGSIAYMPVLTPVETYSWLSQDYFAKYSAERPMHLAYLPGVLNTIELPQEFNDEIKQLAEDGRSVVLDMPYMLPKAKVDDPMPEPNLRYLRDMCDRLAHASGRNIPVPPDIGKQHYYAGKITFLKPDHEDYEEPLSKMAVYKDKVNRKEYPQWGEPTGVFARETMTTEEAEQWWPIYQQRFDRLNRESPCRQGMSKKEFMEAMADPTIIKSILIEKNQPQALAMAGPNDASWLNPEFFKANWRFALDDHLKKIVLFPGIFVDKNVTDMRPALQTIRLLLELMYEAHGSAMVVFDTCDANVRLAEYSEVAARDLKQGRWAVKFQEYATHAYYRIGFPRRTANPR
jgi:hypothetical protein